MISKTADTPPQDRVERLADRVMALAKSIAAQGDGRTVSADAIYAEMPDENRQRLKDAIKTLKDARRLHAIGGGKGVYEIEEFYPAPRSVSVSTLSDGWRLIEVGEQYALAITPGEAATIGSYLAGDAVRVSMLEKLRAIESALFDVRRENALLKQRMRGMTRAAASQTDLFDPPPL